MYRLHLSSNIGLSSPVFRVGIADPLKIDSEIGQDIPARCGEVAPLVRVGGEVEELVRGLCMVDELPSAFSDHIGAAPGSMPVILAKRHPVVVVGVDILKRDAAPAARPMRCCGAEERRLQVELGDGGIHAVPRTEPGTGDYERNPCAILVQTALPPHAELPQHLAVIRSVGDDGISRETEPIVGVEKEPELAVDARAHGSDRNRSSAEP